MKKNECVISCLTPWWKDKRLFPARVDAPVVQHPAACAPKDIPRGGGTLKMQTQSRGHLLQKGWLETLLLSANRCRRKIVEEKILGHTGRWCCLGSSGQGRGTVLPVPRTGRRCIQRWSPPARREQFVPLECHVLLPIPVRITLNKNENVSTQRLLINFIKKKTYEISMEICWFEHDFCWISLYGSLGSVHIHSELKCFSCQEWTHTNRTYKQA